MRCKFCHRILTENRNLKEFCSPLCYQSDLQMHLNLLNEIARSQVTVGHSSAGGSGDIIKPTLATSGILVSNSLTDDLLKYNDGVLASNGKIYGSPYRATKVLEIDPSTSTYTLFGPNETGSLDSAVNKWYNITAGDDGLLYCLPANHDEILEINPDTHEINLYADATSSGASAILWPAAIKANNGKIYGIPNRAGEILEFDPTTKNMIGFSSGSMTANVGKWSKPVLSPDGKIYAGPIAAETRILEFDPDTHDIQFYDTAVSSSGNWNDIIIAPNNNIYLIPLNYPAIGVFDTVSKNYSEIGSLPDTLKFNHSILVGTKVYCIPRKVTYVVEIDTTNDSVTTFGNVGNPDSDLEWNKAVLADNGKIYAAPTLGTTVLEIDPENRTARTFDDYTSASTFKWPYSVLGNNGRIYGIPNNIDSVIEIIPGT